MNQINQTIHLRQPSGLSGSSGDKDKKKSVKSVKSDVKKSIINNQ